MRLSERRLLPDGHRKSQSARVAIAAMVVVLALATPASAGITLVSTPDALAQLYEQVTVTWAETVHCNLSYGRAPGVYTNETAAESWGSLVFTPLDEGMSWGVYYCVVSELGGGETSDEFVLILDSPIFPSPTTPANGFTICETTTTFQWDAVDGAPYYHVLLSDHELSVTEEDGELHVTGASIIWQAITSGTPIQYGSPDPSGYFVASNGTSPPLMSGFSYHWLVFNNFGNNPILTSTAGAGLSSFNVDVAVSMEPPELTFPPDSLLVTEEYLDFSWTPVGGASGYHVYISENRDWSQAEASFPVWDGPAPTPSAQVYLGSFLVSGNYRWRVVALDSSGRGIASVTRSFEYATETGTARIRTRKEDGDPLPNVLVEMEFLTGGVNVLPAVTDALGGSDVALIPGEYAFHASKPDYVDTTATAVIVANENPYVTITMRRASARMRGVVEDEEGAPMFDADVMAISDALVLETKSDPTGNFAIQASAGVWEVHAEKAGYAPSSPIGVELHASDYIELADPLTLVGTPGTATGNIMNEAGSPIVGATVLAQSSFGTLEAFTNASGYFSLELAPGEWTLAAEKSGFVPSDGRGIIVDPGENTAVEPPIVLTTTDSAVMGRVTDGRVDYSDARVVAIPPFGEPLETTTNAFGEFVLLLPPDVYELIAESDGSAPSAPHQVNVESGESYLGIELIVAPAECELIGVVVDGTDPVDGALVTNGAMVTTTSAAGEFTLEVPAGLHELTAHKDGYLSATSLQVAVQPGGPLEGLELEITGGASAISGHALCAGDPVGRAVVTALSGDIELAAVAEEDGSYVVHVEAGEWTVTAWKDGFGPSSSEVVVVAAGQSAQGISPELVEEYATIEGSVTDSRAMLSTATVLLYAGGERYRTSCNSDGRYTLRVAPCESYQVIAHAPWHDSACDGVYDLIAGDERVVNMELPARESRIACTVTGVGGLPVVDASMSVSGTAVGSSTNALGDFEAYVEAGPHDVRIWAHGYEPFLHSDVPAVAGETTELDCELVDVFGTLQGTVVDSVTSEPVPGVVITVVWRGGLSAVTGPGGDYELTQVIPEEVPVVATKKGFVAEEQSLTLSEHEVRDHDIDLVRLTGSISGQVTDSSASVPVAGVSVRARLGEDIASAAMTGADGRYVLSGLYPGVSYNVHASRAGYSADSENPRPDVTPDAVDIDFTLRECTGVITGFVLDGDDGEPLPGASVTADNGLGHFGTTTSGADGSFTIDGLAEIGTYDMSASLYGYFDALAYDVEPGGDALTLEMPRNFAKLIGTLTPQGAGVELGETVIAATNIAFAEHSRTASPDPFGAYEITELLPGSYVLSIAGGTHLGTPAQVSLTAGEGELVSGVDFTVERATIERIDVAGPDEIEAGHAATFSGSVLAQGERLVNADLDWWVAPDCAGSVARTTGELSISAGYIGELTVSAREPGSGEIGRAEATVYVTVTPGEGASAGDSLGMTLYIEPGAVSETKSIYLSHELLPDVRRYSKGHVVEARSYRLKPNGMSFEDYHHPTLTVPDDSRGGGLVRWDRELLDWAEVEAEHVGSDLEAEIPALAEFAVRARSGPLGVSDVRAEPNPFAPANGPVTIYYELSSDAARMPIVTVRIYNMAGQFVRLIPSEFQGKGRASVKWDGLTDSDETARNGRYVVEVSAKDTSGTETALGTVVLVK